MTRSNTARKAAAAELATQTIADIAVDAGFIPAPEAPEAEAAPAPEAEAAPAPVKLTLSEAVAKSWEDETIKAKRSLRHACLCRPVGAEPEAAKEFASVPLALRDNNLRPKDRANSVPAGSKFLPVSKEQKLRADLVAAFAKDPLAEIERHGFIFRLVAKSDD